MDTEELEILGHKMKFAKSRGHIFGSDQLIMERHWKPKPGDLCLDIGCGPGTWSYVAAARGAHVIAYDPKPEVIQIVREQAELNGWSNLITAVQAAVWKKSGSIGFGTNSCKEAPTRLVDAVSIDDEFSVRKGPDFMNVDAEWSDVEVLEGAVKTIARCSPKIILEVHDRSTVPALECLIRDADTRYRIHEEGQFLVAEVARK